MDRLEYLAERTVGKLFKSRDYMGIYDMDLPEQLLDWCSLPDEIEEYEIMSKSIQQLDESLLSIERDRVMDDAITECDGIRNHFICNELLLRENDIISKYN